MARSIVSPLRNRTSRLKLPVQRKPHKVTVSNGVRLCYRRNENGALSSWSVETADWLKRFATADDFLDANGRDVMNYDQAVQAALKLARGSDDQSGRPETVREAVAAWQTDLESRGGRAANATAIQFHLEGTVLNGKTVLALSI